MNIVAGERIQDVSDICRLREEAKLGCRNCVFYDSVARRCPRKEDIKLYRAQLAARRNSKIRLGFMAAGLERDT